MPLALQKNGHSVSNSSYQFTNDWFVRGGKSVWDSLIPQINPTRILEIGSFEGASLCYLIDKLSPRKALEIHCIDSWQGGVEHQAGSVVHAEMSDVEKRFAHNTRIAIDQAPHKVGLTIHKGNSDLELAKLLASGKAEFFDFIYIDGSHQAPDVLLDALMSFKLLRVNGVIAFDDYLWQEQLSYGTDPIRCPKMAIDAFVNIYCRKLRVISAPLYQLYVQKVSN
jgi:predicted O-methyltransferase YrrM